MTDERISDNQIASWDALFRTLMPILRTFSAEELTKAVAREQHVNTITPDQITGWDYAYKRAKEFSNVSVVKQEVIDSVKDYIIYAEDLTEGDILQVQTVGGTKKWVNVTHQHWGDNTRVITPDMSGDDILEIYDGVTDHASDNRYTFIILPGSYTFTDEWTLKNYKDVVTYGDPTLLFDLSGSKTCLKATEATVVGFHGSPCIKVATPSDTDVTRIGANLTLLGFEDKYVFKVLPVDASSALIFWHRNPSGINLVLQPVALVAPATTKGLLGIRDSNRTGGGHSLFTALRVSSTNSVFTSNDQLKTDAYDYEHDSQVRFVKTAQTEAWCLAFADPKDGTYYDINVATGYDAMHLFSFSIQIIAQGAIT